jgi:thiamine pyrophosphate-dependent acetolactate synthase large subunit-like protein
VRATEVAEVVVRTLPEALCVSSLGTATSALRLASGDAGHFYFGASMGSALAGAMGVADALPDRLVVALLGDGELLMGAATLWSVSAYRPDNLLAVVLADGAYSITGGQPLPSVGRFVEVAGALGGIDAVRVHDRSGLTTALTATGGPRLIEAVLDERVWPGPSPFVDPGRVRLEFERRVAAGVAGPAPAEVLAGPAHIGEMA